MIEKVVVSAFVYPTESEEKVRKAVANLFDLSMFEERSEDLGDIKRVEFVCEGPDARLALGRLYELLREQGILDAARRVMMEGMTAEGTILFHLHKQAAFAGAVNFAEGGESPLGPIVVEVYPRDPKKAKRVIDWLAPETEDGKPKYEVRI